MPEDVDLIRSLLCSKDEMNVLHAGAKFTSMYGNRPLSAIITSSGNYFFYGLQGLFPSQQPPWIAQPNTFIFRNPWSGGHLKILRCNWSIHGKNP